MLTNKLTNQHYNKPNCLITNHADNRTRAIRRWQWHTDRTDLFMEELSVTKAARTNSIPQFWNNIIKYVPPPEGLQHP